MMIYDDGPNYLGVEEGLGGWAYNRDLYDINFIAA